MSMRTPNPTTSPRRYTLAALATLAALVANVALATEATAKPWYEKRANRGTVDTFTVNASSQPYSYSWGTRGFAIKGVSYAIDVSTTRIKHLTFNGQPPSPGYIDYANSVLSAENYGDFTQTYATSLVFGYDAPITTGVWKMRIVTTSSTEEEKLVCRTHSGTRTCRWVTYRDTDTNRTWYQFRIEQNPTTGMYSIHNA